MRYIYTDWLYVRSEIYAKYVVTKESIKNLKEEGISNHIIKYLRNSIDTKYADEDGLHNEISSFINVLKKDGDDFSYEDEIKIKTLSSQFTRQAHVSTLKMIDKFVRYEAEIGRFMNSRPNEYDNFYGFNRKAAIELKKYVKEEIEYLKKIYKIEQISPANEPYENEEKSRNVSKKNIRKIKWYGSIESLVELLKILCEKSIIRQNKKYIRYLTVRHFRNVDGSFTDSKLNQALETFNIRSSSIEPRNKEIYWNITHPELIDLLVKLSECGFLEKNLFEEDHARSKHTYFHLFQHFCYYKTKTKKLEKIGKTIFKYKTMSEVHRLYSELRGDKDSYTPYENIEDIIIHLKIKYSKTLPQ